MLIAASGQAFAKDLPTFIETNGDSYSVITSFGDAQSLTSSHDATTVDEFNQLGIRLAVTGNQTASFPLLMDAALAFQRALALTDHSQQKAAVIESNLGLTLTLLGRLVKDETILDQAEIHHQQAIAVLHSLGDVALAELIRRRSDGPEAGSVAAIDDNADMGEGFGRKGTRLRTHATDQEETEHEFEAQSVFEVMLSGSLQSSIVTGSDDILDDGYSVDFEAETDIAADFETDQGLDYGAVASFELDDPTSLSSLIHMSGGFGEVRLGEDSGAEDDMFVGGGDAQAGTGGIDGDTTNLVDVSMTGSESAAKISYYTPRARGVQIGASFTPDTDSDEDFGDERRFEDHVGLGTNWVSEWRNAQIIASLVGSFGKATAGDDLESYGVGVNVQANRLQYGAGYVTETNYNKQDLLNFGASYSTDPWLQGFGGGQIGAGLSFLFPREGKTSTVLALSGDWLIGNGLSLLGDISYNSRDAQTSSGKASSVSTVLAIGLDY